VESGSVDAGFVYKTDARVSKQVKVVYEIPVTHAPRVVYPVAIVKESKKKKVAADFLNFTSSPAGKERFTKYGFVVLD
jgi:molybdate transport system substrate-binding protein